MDTTPLSPREVQICRLIATGATNREIAGVLELSENTVEFHLRNIFQKLYVASRTQVAIFYLKNKGTLEPLDPPTDPDPT
jgi:DNA-binding NarL/FixJ family response regulator